MPHSGAASRPRDTQQSANVFNLSRRRASRMEWIRSSRERSLGVTTHEQRLPSCEQRRSASSHTKRIVARARPANLDKQIENQKMYDEIKQSRIISSDKVRVSSITEYYIYIALIVVFLLIQISLLVF